MKLKTLGMLTGLALLAVPAASAFAHTDVYLDFGLAAPPPPAVYVEEEAPVYYEYQRPRVVYYHDYPYRDYYYGHPRYSHHGHWRHDHGWHGHHHDRD